MGPLQAPRTGAQKLGEIQSCENSLPGDRMPRPTEGLSARTTGVARSGLLDISNCIPSGAPEGPNLPKSSELVSPPMS